MAKMASTLLILVSIRNESMSSVFAYSNRIIAFIDVLGFGTLVESSATAENGGAEAIKRISEAILESLDELAWHTSKEVPPFALTQFSDSFVISCESKGPPSRDLLFFSNAVRNVIDSFLRSSLLLRGGITRGLLVHNEKLLFGPAMNRAYFLENEIAQTPRIIVDPELPDLGQVVLDFDLAVDKDGIMYIDYFRISKMFFLRPQWWLVIQDYIGKMPKTPKLADKRAWLVEKYNNTIDGFTYASFEKTLMQYAEDTDNNAVYEDRHKFLSAASQIHRME